MTTRRPRPRAPEGAFLLLALTGCAGAPARPGEAVVPGADPAQAEARALAAEARKAPAQAEGWLRAARAFERLGADRQAAEVCAEALRAVSGDRGALLRVAAGAAERAGRASVAARWLGELLRAAPDDIETALRLAITESRAGRTREARKRVGELVGSGRCPAGRGLVARGWVELHAGNGELARTLALLASEKEPVRASRLLGLVLAREGRLREAADHLRAALEGDPEDWEGWLLLGQVLLVGGQAAGAREVLGRVLDVRPRHPGALLWAGLASAADGRTDEARAQLAQALQAGERVAHLPLGLLGGSGGAEAHLRAYLAAFPATPSEHPARAALREAGR